MDISLCNNSARNAQHFNLKIQLSRRLPFYSSFQSIWSWPLFYVRTYRFGFRFARYCNMEMKESKLSWRVNICKNEKRFSRFHFELHRSVFFVSICLNFYSFSKWRVSLYFDDYLSFFPSSVYLCIKNIRKYLMIVGIEYQSNSETQ